jgi:hypothetical protein
LLTGFDAPVEQVMYLDKPLRDHNLLQAIARGWRDHHIVWTALTNPFLRIRDELHGLGRTRTPPNWKPLWQRNVVHLPISAPSTHL